ncbi:response regulator (plasmid) [Pseudoalteromonas xiamenensis]|uniref:response regulator n=1 Tax=Pseudoalteromonas xiamenensis TaxID=882626 RepID=UPI0027E5A66D|nr:response regulator [Pseudoalteromonas xiamenensis]WMN62014.1 response regulator [Pseudoalteromonas xiamenensis]
MRILVVDDMPLMRHVLINMLRKLEYSDIVEATDGKQALELLQSRHFDLVISDLHMPKMNGKDLVSTMHNDNKLKSIPVMIVTCEDNKEKIHELIKERIDGFIVKPFCLTTLEKQLKYIMAKQNSSQRQSQVLESKA